MKIQTAQLASCSFTDRMCLVNVLCNEFPHLRGRFMQLLDLDLNFYINLGKDLKYIKNDSIYYPIKMKYNA